MELSSCKNCQPNPDPEGFGSKYIKDRGTSILGEVRNVEKKGMWKKNIGRNPIVDCERKRK